MKRGLLVAGSGALLIATPASVMAHGDRGDDNNRRGRDDRGSSQRGDFARSDNDGNRWWKPWHRDNDKPKPPVDPATCAEWQTRLNEWVANYKNTATKDIALGTSYTAMIQGFVTEQGLAPNNYDALLANVDAKKVAAQTAVDGMAAPDLNCEEDAAETTERGIDKSSFKDAKRAMEEYKQSLKELTEAVRASYGGSGFMQ